MNSLGRFDIFNYKTTAKEDVLQFSKNASAETGIRLEFLIAIFGQESSYGKNYGSCFLFDPKLFGGGIGVNMLSGIFTEKIMKPSRDIEPFFSIMKDVGRNPYFTPVSCPMKTGWGGAMGPLQFIPSTWILVRDRAAGALLKTTVDPWLIEDALMAAAIYLKDLGADEQNIKNEREVACRYFSGKSCGNKKSMNAKYGDSIIKKMRFLQIFLNPTKEIKVLKKVAKKKIKKHHVKHHKKSKKTRY